MHRYRLLLLLCSLSLPFSGTAQKSWDKQIAEVTAEGKRLYRSEKASWEGTDLFMARYETKEKIGGYFSYEESPNSVKCIFYSNAEPPMVIGTINFDSSLRADNAYLDLMERNFTPLEADYAALRNAAKAAIQHDTSFKTYQNTHPNIVPLVDKANHRVYVLTGPQQNGVVIFGADYLLQFDEQNKHTGTRQLHRNIIPIEFNPGDTTQRVSMHTHLPETGTLMTATDICTLMLYEQFTGWTQHNVITKDYLSVWNCSQDQLSVISMKVLKKVSKHMDKIEQQRKEKD